MNKKKRKSVSVKEPVTNGEAALMSQLQDFVNFLKAPEGYSLALTVPTRVYERYLDYRRREQMRYVSELRVSRGEKPLPRKLTDRPLLPLAEALASDEDARW